MSVMGWMPSKRLLLQNCFPRYHCSHFFINSSFFAGLLRTVSMGKVLKEPFSPSKWCPSLVLQHALIVNPRGGKEKTLRISGQQRELVMGGKGPSSCIRFFVCSLVACFLLFDTPFAFLCSFFFSFSKRHTGNTRRTRERRMWKVGGVKTAIGLAYTITTPDDEIHISSDRLNPPHYSSASTKTRTPCSPKCHLQVARQRPSCHHRLFRHCPVQTA